MAEKSDIVKIDTDSKDYQDKKFRSPSVERHDNLKIVLPREMTFKKAVEWIKTIEEEEMSPINILAEIPCFPLDGAVQFWRAMVEVCGFASAVPVPGWFGHPPYLIDVPIGPGKTMQVPYGKIITPAFSGGLETKFKTDEGKPPAFVVTGSVRKKDKGVVEQIINRTRELVATQSIYRGQAIRVSYKYLEDARDFDFQHDAPKYIDTSRVNTAELIFSRQTQDALDVGLFALIERTQQCRDMGVPIKSGILLAGEYGTGKTQTALVTSKKCVDNKWTFMYVENVRHLPEAIRMAALYDPCVIFAEDLDRVTSGERTAEIDSILNTIDGVDTKGKEIVVVCTTNNLEKIQKGVIRPGRFDTLVEVLKPDAEAAARLVKLYGRDTLDPKLDMADVGRAVAGMRAATIRVVVEKAKIMTLLRAGKIDHNVSTSDVVAAANAIKSHDDLVNRQDPPKPTAMEISQAQGELGFARLASAVRLAGKHPVEGLLSNGLPPLLETIDND